jgi:hypothetical protein
MPVCNSSNYTVSGPTVCEGGVAMVPICQGST